MGTICILLGIILLIVSGLGGFFIAHAVVGNELYMSLLGMQNVTMVYVVAVGAMFLVGLLICLNLVMHGLTYNRVCKNRDMLKRILRS